MEYETFKELSSVALRQKKADLVLKNARVMNVFTGEILENDVAVKGGFIAAVGKEYEGKEEVDLKGSDEALSCESPYSGTWRSDGRPGCGRRRSHTP